MKITIKNITSKIAIAVILGGIVVPLSSVYAQTQQITRDEMVGRLIVKFKSNAHSVTNDIQSQTLPTLRSKKSLERLQQLIDRVQKMREARKSYLLRNQKNVPPDVASRMQPLKAISKNTLVISLKDVVSRSEADQLMKDIAEDTTVEYVEPDLHVTHFMEPNDTRYHEQWAYLNTIGGANLPAAWSQTEGSSDIVVAVIDTGYVDHADLKDNLQLTGYDFISDPFVANGGGLGSDGRDFGDWITNRDTRVHPLCQGARPESSSWHGSHVAGTIGAVSGNNLGVTGISWKGKILPVRVLGKCGGYLSDVVDGMRWAAGLSVENENVPINKYPAKVLNLSLGAYAKQCSQLFSDAIHEINNAGATIVVAAGNSKGPVAESMPANCPGVIAVSATDQVGNLASFSNYGPEVTISAPGVDILSTFNKGSQSPVLSPAGDDYKFYQGTSMAAPHVAGTVALMLAVNPHLTPEQIKQYLQKSAKPFPGGSCTTAKCGAGLLDAGKAVELAKEGR